ncbi:MULTISPECIES: hypothetical protein [unclassified Roseofilum]|uniref:hypothetical protein n=1 Tax=unclassified Roseofilum TaxID=2620099 RepID=UPI001B1AD43E|nr:MULTISPECIES: hypothetical protein [unclassified Roseofilum]MBP0010267.1 hypothetical protein [Roseofilum sp. Belize Diploria]MBP0012400.1 hypothetical protein [Roseofilum sp. SID3]MBP0023411.1 hypothetical protein [Roseofilum sp. SID2]MBP0034594.1 hypothetical protein [Roseofilum sp. Belize BBD 4]MBP0038715.1 hypothetical protein [Roseofilum sp. SID1]
MIIILIIVIALVAWSLHLMESAIHTREFSLMLAGVLVAGAAVAMVAVYFLMGHYFGYLNETARLDNQAIGEPREVLSWLVEFDEAQQTRVGGTEMSGYPNLGDR